MVFVPKTDWQDSPSTATPITAAHLIRIENGVAEGAQDATETQKGNVELATAAEMTTGTDLTRAPSVKRVVDHVSSAIATAIAGGVAPTTHTHPATQISDSTTVGRSVLTAATAATARTAIGGTTTGVALFTAPTQADARTALGIAADTTPLFARAVYDDINGWPVRPDAVAVDYFGGVLSDPPLDRVANVDSWTLPASEVT